MPYTGQPSHGCETCKKRHIKCDETRPVCRACTSSKRVCPGYKHRLDLVMRSQNITVRQAVERRLRKSLMQRSQCEESSLQAVPTSLTEPLNARATQFFFRNYALDLIALDSLTGRGYLEYLFPLYSDAKPDSPLSLATVAVSLCIFGAWQKENREAENESANETFSRALVSTQQAILDPLESKTNSTLMAVLMLGLYESLTRRYRSQRPSTKHHEGAVALVKHRGVRNFQNELSRRLLTTVRSQSLEQGVVDAEIWEEPNDMLQKPGTLLDVLMKDTFNMAPEEADAHLATWPQSIPESWHPVRVESSIESYDGCDVYPDLAIMRMHNQWRCARIKAGGAIQEMVDGICGSVPFALGDRTSAAPLYQPGANYPHLEGVPTSEQHYRAASSVGGWYLLGPLTLVMGLGTPLRGGQREWVMRQMRRVARIYEIKSDGPG